MIDPYNITNFNRTEAELQELLMFCILVAGKTAYIQAGKLEQFLNSIRERLMLSDQVKPFEIIKSANDHGILLQEIQKAKLGQYNKITKAFDYLINNKIDLFKCGPMDLEKVPGIGMKTSRFFILHSRNIKTLAVLDVHILKFLGTLGYKVPKTTPNQKQYYYLEQKFLEYCRANDLHPATADLEIWKSYAKKEKEVSSSV
jgi:thermostable 8-oxoguanine DNA glycosylase